MKNMIWMRKKKMSKIKFSDLPNWLKVWIVIVSLDTGLFILTVTDMILVYLYGQSNSNWRQG